MEKQLWTIKKIKDGFEKFYEAHKHHPTATEIDEYTFLPSSRQLQRRFGGLPQLRRQLAMGGPEDFTKGAYSSERARTINKRAHALGKKVYAYLVTAFGKPFVHREYFFTDDARTRTDFFIYSQNGNFSIDVFYPKDLRNLAGCLNSKMKTYRKIPLLQYPVIFLMMNEDIREEEIRDLLAHKKNSLLSYQNVMTFSQVKNFCKNKVPLQIEDADKIERIRRFVSVGKGSLQYYVAKETLCDIVAIKKYARERALRSPPPPALLLSRIKTSLIFSFHETDYIDTLNSARGSYFYFYFSSRFSFRKRTSDGESERYPIAVLSSLHEFSSGLLVYSSVGVPRIELGSHAPEACILPLYYTPTLE